MRQMRTARLRIRRLESGEWRWPCEIPLVARKWNVSWNVRWTDERSGTLPREVTDAQRDDVERSNCLLAESMCSGEFLARALMLHAKIAWRLRASLGAPARGWGVNIVRS
jgi:hypothetical protein